MFLHQRREGGAHRAKFDLTPFENVTRNESAFEGTFSTGDSARFQLRTQMLPELFFNEIKQE